MTDRSRLRLVVLSVLILSLVVTLLGRLWYLQVLAAPTYRAAAQDNQIRNIVTEAPRGEVVDDKGRPLIDNHYALVVSVDRIANQRLGTTRGEAVLHRLARVLHTPYQRIVERMQICGTKRDDGTIIGQPCWNGSVYEPIPVLQLKPTKQATKRALAIQEMSERFPGVTVQLAAVRHYPKPAGALASSILGYTSPISAAALKKLTPLQQDIQRGTQVGSTGLEASYEKYLHGRPGVKQVAVDHVGAVTSTIRETPPRTGDTVVTNLDAKAQATLEKSLHQAILAARHQGHTADYAAGVVLNVRNGGVVAMGSEPTYQPNHSPSTLSPKQYRKLLHAKGSPLLDKSFQGSAAPGSTFKLISSLGLIADHRADIGGAYDCPTNFQNRHNFDGENGKGFISFHEALVVSCDTFFFKLGYEDWQRDAQLIADHKKPLEGVQALSRQLGMDGDPGIDLPGAAYGSIGDRAKKKAAWDDLRDDYCKGAQTRPKGSMLQRLDAYDCRYGYIWQPGDQENEDIGQGTVTVSPLQLAVAYAAVANGGTIYEPRVAKAIMSPSGKLVKRIPPKVRGHLPVPPEVVSYLRDALYGVVGENGGTAHGLYSTFPLGKVKVGGKTGTAELPNTNEDGSWFASFAGPAGGKPQFVTIVEVDKGDQGAITSAPTSVKLYDALYGLQGAKPIFTNGVPPAKLPKTGLAALNAKDRKHASGGHGSTRQPTHGTTHTPMPNPSSPTPGPGLTALAPENAYGVRSRIDRSAGGSGA